MNDIGISSEFREKLEKYLINFRNSFNKMIAAYNDSLNLYVDSMPNSFDQSGAAYFDETSLKELHFKAKNESLAQV